MRNERGFTLIELVVVIVILGVLAAVAVPKFADMQVDARQSALSGLVGSVRSASSLAHAQALVKGQTAAAGTITMEGVSIALDYGYPDLVGIGNALTYDGFSYNNTTGVFSLNGVANCTLTYVAATNASTPPTFTVVNTCQ